MAMLPHLSLDPLPDDERRQHRRMAVTLRALYRSPHQTLDTRVSNLSQGGLFLSAPRCDAMGTPAKVELEIPGEDRRFVFSGEVAWCDMQGTGIGLRFHEPRREARLALANFLLRLAQNSAAREASNAAYSPTKSA